MFFGALFLTMENIHFKITYKIVTIFWETLYSYS